MSPEILYYAAGIFMLLATTVLVARAGRGREVSRAPAQGPDGARDMAKEMGAQVGNDVTAQQSEDQPKTDGEKVRSAWDEARNVVMPYIAFLHSEMARDFSSDAEKFVYEAGVLLHHLDDDLSEPEATMVVALYAAEAYGRGQEGKALFTAFKDGAHGDTKALGAADLDRLHVRMGQAKASA